MIPQYLVDFDLKTMPSACTDVVIIGSGIAGLFTALKAAETRKVTLITKRELMESNTRYAQGGIAAVMSEEDSTAEHVEDTLIAGAGLCRPEAVQVLAEEGPAAVRELMALGAEFDQEDGRLALTKEGAHSHRRILHAHGDATGYEIVRALAAKARNHANIKLLEHHYVIDLVQDELGCRGVLVQRPDGERLYLQSTAVVLCSGGAGQLYRYTTNPEVATADGLAIAYRAGAVIRDAEFIQFHPTALCYAGAPRFLISEAVRGEGAVLRNSRGERFMEKYHPQLELAPRDVVARAIVSEMEQTHAQMVYLDITHEQPEVIRHRFPTIYETCLSYGLDMTTDWIPVAPAAHYMMGGVRTNLDGETNIPRLFACGEVSSTGVHGANRLASNSLSEALVFGSRIVKRIKELAVLPEQVCISKGNGSNGYDTGRTAEPAGDLAERKLNLQKTMVRNVGLRRTGALLQEGLEGLKREQGIFQAKLETAEQLEFANMLTSSLLIAQMALQRQESRGGHYREDYPERNDEEWRKHQLCRRDQQLLEVQSV
ncbi:L-aspartate oxidase [Paenibacillus physcomitrellae]|uniref:L-aspartate oxidase n=1 Tax=Paenibacillus physcomitrellae TaxID=1619311 RepID=A0ABQ1GVD2_9BACL|nr:L-aspartate oxidase [Paenibacillus physcomitrellae]GGA50867.1 L-aspartate oxidase [Paenibacillus physcomitrellae]